MKQIKLGSPDSVVIENRGCTYRHDIVLNPKNEFLTENGTLTIYCEVGFELTNIAYWFLDLFNFAFLL